MKITSYAKINLNLRIVGRRNDGYHFLQSVLYPVDFLYDDIIISHSTLTKDIIKISRASYIEQFEELLIIKCLLLMRRNFGFHNYFDITLNKKIPIGAGLGGGSSNAAAIICAVDKLLHLDLSIQQKVEIGAQIGADIPFFIYNQPCIVEGIGEQITIIEKPKNHFILLAIPNFNISTPLAYKQYSSTIAKDNLQYSKKLSHEALLSESTIAVNDLQSTAQQIQPKLNHLLNTISHFDGCTACSISGSGSACFGIFQDKISMENAANKLKKQFGKYQFFYGKC